MHWFAETVTEWQWPSAWNAIGLISYQAYRPIASQETMESIVINCNKLETNDYPYFVDKTRFVTHDFTFMHSYVLRSFILLQFILHINIPLHILKWINNIHARHSVPAISANILTVKLACRRGHVPEVLVLPPCRT